MFIRFIGSQTTFYFFHLQNSSRKLFQVNILTSMKSLRPKAYSYTTYSEFALLLLECQFCLPILLILRVDLVFWCSLFPLFVQKAPKDFSLYILCIQSMGKKAKLLVSVSLSPSFRSNTNFPFP